MLKKYYSGELVREGRQEGHISLNLDITLNEIDEKESSSKYQPELVHSTKIKYGRATSQSTSEPQATGPTSCTGKNQVVTATISRLEILTSTHIVTHSSSATWILTSPIILTSRVSKIAVPVSNWPVTPTHWTPTGLSKGQLHWPPIGFPTSVTLLNPTRHSSIWSASSRVYENIFQSASFDKSTASISARVNSCQDEAGSNFTSWSMRGSGRIVGPTFKAASNIPHKWAKSTAPPTSMTEVITSVVSSPFNRTPTSNISQTPLLFSLKNQADSLKSGTYEIGSWSFLFFLIAVYITLAE